ncbi:MAG: HAD family hydrolase, partial [Acidobacteriota bacterium]
RVLPEEDYWSHFVGLDDRACLLELLERAGEAADAGRIARLIARKSSRYQELIRRDGYPYFPGAAALVRGLAEAEMPLGLVSGALRDEVEGALRQEGLRGCFKTLVTADDVGTSKPDPEGYRRGIQALNSAPPLPDRLLHPHEILAIEDTMAGVEAALAAGLTVVAVAHTHPAAKLEGAHRVVARIAELEVEDLMETGNR